MHLRGATLDDLLRQLYRVLLDCGAPIRATRGANHEIIAVQLELDAPLARLSRSESRGRPFSALGEFLWYLTKDNQLDFIRPYIPRYKDESRDGLTVHGGYGPRLFGQRGHDQVANAIAQLRSSPASRRAVIQLFNAEDNARRHEEVPCTTTLQFLLRDGALHLIATLRSNDAYLGLPHDVFCFTMLQEMVARVMGVELGRYWHSAGSMHLYDKHQAAARRYLDEGLQRSVAMPPMPASDPWPAVRTVFDAERRVRNGDAVDAGGLGLDPYWADIVRLLQIHFAQGDEARLNALRAALVHPGYRGFVDGQRGKAPRMPDEPAQGSLWL